MKTPTRPIAFIILSACAWALGGCAGGVARIEDRQGARTDDFEARQDRYDARYEGRKERRQIRSDRADARYSNG